jgi:hypothetical protein
LYDSIPKTSVRSIGVVSLKAYTEDLIWVGDTTSKHFRSGAENEIVKVRQFGFVAFLGTFPILKLLVSSELHGAVRDSENGRGKTTPEAFDAFVSHNIGYTMNHASVGSWRVLASREHAGFDDPYWVGEDCSEDALSDQYVSQIKKNL